MKPLNQVERTKRWGQFIGLYATLLLLTALSWWLSLALIPRLTSVQQNQTMQELMAYRKQLTGTDKMLTDIEQGAPLTDNWLRTFYANASALDQQFPKPLFMATTNSYRQLAGEYENARKIGDEGVQLLNSQKIQLEAKKAALLAAMAATGKELKEIAAAPKPGGAKPAPAAPAGPVINPGLYGPFKPLLISGTGEFGKNQPEINASVQFMIVREHQVVLAVYFETGGAEAGTLAKVTERKELYTAPPGFKIVGLSVPERTPWRINYVDKNTKEDQFAIAEGLMTLLINGNTTGLDIGATGGSALSIQLKKQIKVELEKE
ncbi:hypothetical protein G8759_10845 [Spirosoma aureum]|uniref:Uncharacterized protein n=1 Tax=Spirosoma aureum TaxID=2692134 RepID=A0A6G9AL81_9BACT|nr:hypothetical protein [Spirosoma aureum]QIP13086.1 hypothetical protein G8759_10845 [Spirosoma aureum]